MHKKPLSSRFPHTVQLAAELGKPVVFFAAEEAGGALAITEYAAIVIGPFEFPYATDGYVNPEATLPHDDLLRTGQSARALAAHPTWPELWQGGLGQAVGGSLVVGDAGVEKALAAIDRQGARYGLPPVHWDWLVLPELYGRAAARDFRGGLQRMAEELRVEVPGTARRTLAEPILLARLFEATLAAHGARAVAECRRRREPDPPEAEDPFGLTPAPGPARPELRVVERAPAPPAEDPFETDGFDGDTVPPMTPFYGGAYTLQELADTLIARLIEQGLVANYADVVGVLRGLGLVVEKSRDPYQGIVVETAIRAKRRLKGRYYRPNFAAAASESPAPARLAPPPPGRVELLDRLEEQVRDHPFGSLAEQFRRVEADFPQATLPAIDYALSLLLDQGRLTHEQVADESVQAWLTDAVAPLARRDGPVYLKALLTSLLNSPGLTESQKRNVSFVQIRVALHRNGIVYPARKRAG
jgi:hypothetical protein